MVLLNLRVSYLVAKRESDDFDMMMKLLVMMIRKITQCKRACDFGIAFWIGKFRNNSFRNFSLDFFLLWIDVSFFWALDRY
ncbi:unnamed protein product [Rhizophagus irregularis]|nr:unnamed protein product [Rhizophagus irregularis]